MQKIIKKIIHNLLDIFGYNILKKEELINFRLDDFKKSLETNDFSNIENNENLISYISKNFSKSHSQIFQDLFVDFILKKKNGFYCEVGAFDGVTFSNTLYLEKELNWTGILCEPNKKFYSNIELNRSKNIFIKKPIFDFDSVKVKLTHAEGGRSFISKDNDVNNNQDIYETTTLNSIFKKYLKNNTIDYLSVDTEGSEYEILQGLNFELYKPNIITVEHNYNIQKRRKIYNLLVSKKYKRVFKSLSRFEDWYIAHD
jgi:FkbM family methyltransferase